MLKLRINILAIFLVLISSSFLMSKDANILPWGVGEKLTFSIRWGIITCGYAHMEVREKIRLAGRDTYRIVVLARSAPFFDPFYKVRDRIESYIDRENLYTVRFEKELREGRYRNDTVIIYDHKNRVAYENEYKFKITEGVQDVLSALYYLRTKDLKVGARYEFDVGTDKKTWPLVVNVIKKEEITTPLGKFKTILVIPKLREEGIFKAKGDLKVWLTDDERKIPVKMRSKIDIGSITAILIEKNF